VGMALLINSQKKECQMITKQLPPTSINSHLET
jgi:hypothetical protein